MSDNLAGTDKTKPTEKPKEHEGLIAEFFHSAAYSALQEPIKGVSQIVDQVTGSKLADSKISNFLSAPEKGSGTGDWMAQNLGGAVGMLAPFLLVRGGARGLMGESIKGTETAATLGMSLKEAGLTGFVYDSVLKPTDANSTGNFWVNRGLNGVSGAATFMTLTGAAYGMGKFGNFAESKAIGTSSLVPLMRNPLSAGILSGVPAGLVAAEGSSLVNNRRFATGQEIGGSIAGMSFVGGIFGANEVVKAKYTDGQSVAGFLFDKAKTSWTTPIDKGPMLAAGDEVVGDGTAKYSVALDGTAFKGTKADHFDKLTARPESAELVATTNLGTNGAGVARVDTYESNDGGKRPTSWKNYELTRPDGSKATFEMMRAKNKTGDPSYVYREGNNQVVLKVEDGWQHPKGVTFPRGDATTNVQVRVDSGADMINVHPVVVDALINDPILKPLVADWKSQDITQALDGTKMGTGEKSKGFVIYPRNEEATEPIAQRLNAILSQRPLAQAVDDGATTGAVGRANRVTVTREAVERSVDSTKAQALAKLDDSLSAAIKMKLAVKDGEQPSEEQLKEVETKTGLQPGSLGIDSQGALVLKVSPDLNGDYPDGVYLPDTGAKDQASGSFTDRRAYYALARAHGLEPTTSHLDRATATLDALGEPSLRKIKITAPKDREQDMRDGIQLLQKATKTGATQEDLSNFVQFASQARGVNLADGLRHIANQFDGARVDDAHNLIDHAYAIPEANGLLTTAAGDDATAEDRAAFEEYARLWGGTFKDELVTTAQGLKNADIAQALVEKAYAERGVNIEIPPGQRAAFDKGLEILQNPNGIDQTILQKFAQPSPVGYGPGMEGSLAEAAGQLRLGADAQIAILEAYHGAPMKEGVALLKAGTLDEDALVKFAQGNGKALHAEMAGAAAELGLTGATQRAVLDAYKGKKAWVSVEGTPAGTDMPVPPEKEIDFLQAIETAKMSVDPYTDPRLAVQYRQMLRTFLANPENASLLDPLIGYYKVAADYAEPTQLPSERLQIGKAGALMREAVFGIENEHITGRPDHVQVDLSASPQTDDFVNRIQDFDDLANELARATNADMDAARASMMNWLVRNDPNPDMHTVVEQYAQQSADSRVVSAIDSYLGTNNMEPFLEGKARYETVASSITPELIEQINQEGNDLFWQLAPGDPKESLMWGGKTHASKIAQAYKIDIPDEHDGVAPEEKAVTAYFKRHLQGISEIEDQPDGTRTITYNAETAKKTGISIVRQLPNHETINVQPDGSWYSELSNGNMVEEFAPGHLRADGKPTNLVRHIKENGVETYLYRDGTVETVDKDGQVASTADAAAIANRDKAAEQQQEQNAPKRTSAEVDQLAAKLAADSDATYMEQNAAAITLKNHFGDMSDQQFTDWLEFARGSHQEGEQEVANWQDLHEAGIATLIDNANVQKLMETADGRDLVRNFLDSPKSKTDTKLQLSAWLANPDFAIRPEAWPEWLLNDVRARFKLADGRTYSSSVPENVQQYLAAHPERTEQLATEERPPRAVSMFSDDLPGRLATLAKIVANVPADLQAPLLRLGAQEGRATGEIVRMFEPDSKINPETMKAYTQLLKMTVPNAPDIYSVKLMLNAIKQVGYAAKNDTEAGREAGEQNVAVAMKALAHMTTKENRTEADAILTKLIDGEKAFANRGDKDGGKGDRKKGDRRDQDDKDPRKRKPGPDDGEDNRGGAGSGPVPIEQEFGPNGPEGEDAEAAPGGVDEELENQVENWQATVDGIPAPD